MNTETVETKPKKMPAVVYGLSRTEYDLINRISWSKLKIIGKSPAHYRHALLQPEPERSDALILGNATHVSVFEPEEFSSRFAIWREGRRAGKEWEAFKKSNAGRDILTEDQALEVHAIAKAVRDDAPASKYVSGGRAEVSITWTQTLPEFAGMPEMVAECKGRLDFVADCGVLIDLKTARDGSPVGFGRQAATLSYLGQVSWYRDGYEAATGQRLPFKFIVAEKGAPHVVTVVNVPEELLALGRDHHEYGYRTLLRRLALCRAESRYPGYATTEVDLVLPKWALPQDENMDASDLDFGEDHAD